LYFGWEQNSVPLLFTGMILFIPGEVLALVLMITRDTKTSPELNLGFGEAPMKYEWTGLAGLSYRLLYLAGEIFFEPD
jgi:hypothetical protein